MTTRHLFTLALTSALLLLPFEPSRAQPLDQLKLVLGNINSWDNQAPTLGQEAGFFKKHGLVLENFGTQGTGETLQGVISGSADIGTGVGIAGVMRAYSKGAPVRVLSPTFTGAKDIYWYVRADSPIKTAADVTEQHTIAYSTNGSPTHNIVSAFAHELGVKAKPTATGAPPSTLTQVLSGQIDIGWSAPPLGVREVKDGRIRIILSGDDVPSLRGQTVRVLIVNANTLKDRKNVIARFMDAYRESLDWMYESPEAVKMYAAKINLPEALLRESIIEFQPKEAMQSDRMSKLEESMADAVKLKFLDKPMTQDQLADMIQIPPRKK
ncbi:MAG: NitT/TauT family transport system substrate-binding protein [Alphaproteobacteria bacterium]|jgi:NitT/TauT family transport system substrate-binding protein|nr:NitT/TauT family transport system substrate-binding protein [Alphaproteobacteria bacterium]